MILACCRCREVDKVNPHSFEGGYYMHIDENICRKLGWKG